MKPFRPPHDFECSVCFPPEDRSLWPLAVILMVPVVALLVCWLIR
jgi:hypothetical protein